MIPRCTLIPWLVVDENGVYVLTSPYVVGRIGEFYREVDAHMASAAPDMWEAAKPLAFGTLEFLEKEFPKDMRFRGMAAALRKLKAAVLKSEGRL